MMMRKVFALASVTALTGIMAAVAAAGCSSESNPVTPEPDATPDVKVKNPTPDGGDDDDDPPPESCFSKEAIDATQFPYAKAIKAAGACTNDELKKISAFFKTKAEAKQDALVSEWSEEVSDTCAACVFGAPDAAEWAPILVEDDKLGNVNRGGCIEILSGKESCGQAYQRVTECRLVACLPPSEGGKGSCKTQDEFDACLKDAQGIFTGPCKDAYDLMEQECGEKLSQYEQGCKGTAWTFEGPIKVQCITGGGSGDPDAGDGG